MNTETCKLSLYLENDEALYEQAREIVARCLEENADPEDGINDAADELEGWVTSFLDPQSYADACGVENLGTWLKHYWPMLSDIGDLSGVNWREVAESFKD